MVVTLSWPQCIMGKIDRKTGPNQNKAQQGVYCAYDMMVTSCHGNALRFTGRLWGESTGISQKIRKSDSCISFLVAWTSCSMDCRCGGDLTHWGRVTHICVNKLTVIGSDNCLSPGRRQAIIWTNAGILLIGPLGTNFSEILIKIITFSFKKMRSKVSSGKRRPSCLGLNELTHLDRVGQ